MRALSLTISLLAATTSVAVLVFTNLDRASQRDRSDALAVSAFQAGVQAGRNLGVHEIGCQLHGEPFCGQIPATQKTIDCVQTHIENIEGCLR